MQARVKVQVLLFALLAERAGVRQLVVELPEGATARDLWQRLPAGVREAGLSEESVRVAVNRSYASWDARLQEGDEVAFIPPVAGGNGAAHPNAPAPAVQVRLTREPLSAEAWVRAVAGLEMGAVAVFVGTVRQLTGQRRTLRILYEAYDEMAVAEMERIGQEVVQRYPDCRVALAHRVGELFPGDVSLVVAAACPHRAEAFAALRLAVEAVKARVPIWKKERFEDGEEWVGMGA